MKFNFRNWITQMVVILCFSAASFSEELTAEKFTKLHQELKPSDKDVWRTIPWKIRLLDAQQAAASEQKPIFIWAMDGHPLGCT